jgi:hypothetical protein
LNTKVIVTYLMGVFGTIPSLIGVGNSIPQVLDESGGERERLQDARE